MGMVGTTPAAGRVLLIGDAAGLVNPLQGEGISQAMTSGRSAAGAILGAPGCAAQLYRAALASDHLPYHRMTVAAQAWLVSRPWAVAGVARLLMTVGRFDAMLAQDDLSPSGPSTGRNGIPQPAHPHPTDRRVSQF